MFNQIYCRMGSNQKLPISFITWREKNIHRISIVVPPCDGEPPEGKVRGRYRGFSPSSNLSGCGAMAFLSARSLQRRYACDMPRWWFISKGKKCEFGKKLFSNSFFFGYCWKETTSIRRGKKCSQPAQTNPIVGLPFFTNSKAYQEPSNGQQ